MHGVSHLELLEIVELDVFLRDVPLVPEGLEPPHVQVAGAVGAEGGLHRRDAHLSRFRVRVRVRARVRVRGGPRQGVPGKG